MILSMTGYGRGVISTPDYTITIDIKSINHRYLEFYFKIPRAYSFLEDKLRREISNRISRGKVELTITIEKITADEVSVELNKNLVNSYLKAVAVLKNEYSINGDIDLKTVLTLNDIFEITQPEENQDKLFEIAGQALEEALNSLLISRKAEGEGLLIDIQSKVNSLAELRRNLLDFAPLVVSAYQEKLSKRIQELADGIELDPSRLAMEVAIFADKSDITEELVRIDSHLQQFHHILKMNEPVGRRLDFLIQELNREINTVGSKANDIRIAQVVINFKAELEKIREQIQNIE